MESHKVKVELKHPTILLQTLSIPEWKWEVVTMDFISTLLSHEIFRSQNF
jgi:hypothetical protein